MGKTNLKEKLTNESKNLCYKIYDISKEIPKHELFGIISQLRRAAISIVCNIIEGFARDDWNKSKRDLLKFMEIAYGSLIETKFLVEFSMNEFNINKRKAIKCYRDIDKFGALLFGFVKCLRQTVRT